MDKLVFKVFLISLAISTSTQAFTPLDPINITQKIKSQHFKAVKIIHQDFTNFTGLWKGSCTIDNRVTEETVLIENTANIIDFGNQHYFIGNNLHTESNTSPQLTYIDHRQFDWSKDNKSLIMQGTKVLEDKLKTYLFTNEMSLEQDQLMIRIKVKGFEHMALVYESEGTCELRRI